MKTKDNKFPTISSYKNAVYRLRGEGLYNDSLDTPPESRAEQYFLLAMNALDTAVRYLALCDIEQSEKEITQHKEYYAQDGGTKYWFHDGELHRDDGPAVELVNGTRRWYQNGQVHRLDGPAVEWDDGTKEWYQNGLLHRLDGPAVEWVDGTVEYWENGKRVK